MQRTFNPGEGVGPKVNLSSGCPLPVQASSFIKSEDRKQTHDDRREEMLR
jgi:hypothetical protein